MDFELLGFKSLKRDYYVLFHISMRVPDSFKESDYSVMDAVSTDTEHIHPTALKSVG